MHLRTLAVAMGVVRGPGTTRARLAMWGASTRPGGWPGLPSRCCWREASEVERVQVRRPLHAAGSTGVRKELGESL